MIKFLFALGIFGVTALAIIGAIVVVGVGVAVAHGLHDHVNKQ